MLDLLTSLNSAPGLGLLALIAFCDTLIGVGFFVFGELAFLAAGAAFAATGTIWPAFIVLVSAWAGDMASYLIGSRFGARLSLRYLGMLRRRRAWRRAKSALQSKGAGFVVLSRLLGPVAWVTPFMAGTMGMGQTRFAAAAALGVLLGVGQFLVYGAVGSEMLGHVLPFLTNHLGAIALFASMILAGLIVWRRSESAVWIRALKAALVASLLFLASNLAYFFVFDSHRLPAEPKAPLAGLCHAADAPFLVHPGGTALHRPQPVNVMLISAQSGADLMADLGWHRNMTYSRDEIGFGTYLRLLAQRTPPVSELYLAGHPADSAFQMQGTLTEREHIRWWSMGGGVQFGALSRDQALAIKYYRHLPVLLHDIDRAVDRSRDLLAEQVARSARFEVAGLAPIAAPVALDQGAEFHTDGKVLVLIEKGYSLPPDLRACLGLQAPANHDALRIASDQTRQNPANQTLLQNRTS